CLHTIITPSYTVFFSTVPPSSATYTLSLHDALPISFSDLKAFTRRRFSAVISILLSPLCTKGGRLDLSSQGGLEITSIISLSSRSEEHTSELQSRENLVCRLLLEKKKTEKYRT